MVHVRLHPLVVVSDVSVGNLAGCLQFFLVTTQFLHAPMLGGGQTDCAMGHRPGELNSPEAHVCIVVCGHGMVKTSLSKLVVPTQL